MQPAKKKETFEGKRFPYKMSIQQDRPVLVGAHWHEHIEFMKVLRGPVCIQIENQTYHAQTNEIFFINSCQIHSVTSIPEVTGAIQGMVFDKTLLLQVLESLEINSLISFFTRYNHVQNKYDPTHPQWFELNSVIMKAFEEYSAEKIGYEYSLLSCIYQMIIPLLRLHHPDINKTGSNPSQHAAYCMRLKPAILFIEQHFSEKIYMDNICKTINMSPYHFSNLFKKVFGIPPIQYLTKVRIDRAKRMLLEQDMTITEISEQCGFCNINYFDKVFKDHCQLTPLEFRKRFNT